MVTFVKVRNPSKAEAALNEQAQRIDRRNQKFRQAGEVEKRIIIAKDVLSWMRLKKLVPGHMYINLVDRKSGYDVDDADTVNGYRCHACGIGSLLACATERGAVDTLKNDYGYVTGKTREVWAKLEPLFTTRQLLLIEMAYEGDVDTLTSNESGGTPRATLERAREEFGDTFDEVRKQCYSWRETTPDDTKRMTAIMENIIANKGTFVP